MLGDWLALITLEVGQSTGQHDWPAASLAVLAAGLAVWGGLVIKRAGRRFRPGQAA
jgi:hypothetical protein